MEVKTRLGEDDCRSFFREISIPASSLLPQEDKLAAFVLGLYRWQNPQYRAGTFIQSFPQLQKGWVPLCQAIIGHKFRSC